MSDRDGDNALFAMNPDGGGVTRVLALPPASFRAPVPSPDGRRILVFGNQAWIIRLDTGRRTLLKRSYTEASWAPDGKRIVFTSADNHRLLVADADGSRRRSLLRRPYVAAPAWSPDGKRIAYIEKGGTYVVNADGSGRRRLTRMQAFGDNQISWAPDSASIVFSGSLPESDQPDDLLLVGLDSSVTKLASSAARDLPVWSPDGKRLAFVRDVGPSRGPLVGEVFVEHLASGRARRLTFSRAGESSRSPAWSPDGRSLVYVRGGAARLGELELPELWTIRADGSGDHPLTRAYPLGGSNDSPVWSQGTIRTAARPHVVQVHRRSGPFELHVPYPVDELAAEGPRAVVGPLSQAGPDIIGPKPPIQVWDVSTGAVRSLSGSACYSVLEPALSRRRLLFDCDQSAVDSIFQPLRLYEPGRRLPVQVFLGRNGLGGAMDAGVFVERILGSPDMFAFGTVRSDARGRAVGRRAWRLDRRRPVVIGAGRLAALAGGRIAVERDGEIAVLRRDGTTVGTVREPAARPPLSAFAYPPRRSVALSTGRLLVVSRGHLRLYDITGHLLRTFVLAPKTDTLEAADDEVVVYVRRATVHVLRLRDGHETRIAVPAARPSELRRRGLYARQRVRATITRDGLFLTYNVLAPRPGRVVFIPRKSLGR